MCWLWIDDSHVQCAFDRLLNHEFAYIPTYLTLCFTLLQNITDFLRTQVSALLKLSTKNGVLLSAQIFLDTEILTETNQSARFKYLCKSFRTSVPHSTEKKKTPTWIESFRVSFLKKQTMDLFYQITNLKHNSFYIYLFWFSTCLEQLCADHQECQLYQYNIWYMSLCLGDRPACRSPAQSIIYQMLYWYNWRSLWWAQSCSKHVENRNKYI